MALEFRCANVGVTDCRASFRADTPEDLLAQIAAHAEKVHDVTLNDTLVNYALTTVVER